MLLVSDIVTDIILDYFCWEMNAIPKSFIYNDLKKIVSWHYGCIYEILIK